MTAIAAAEAVNPRRNVLITGVDVEFFSRVTRQASLFRWVASASAGFAGYRVISDGV